MDKKLDWSWLPLMMPGVQKLMRDRRKAVGDAHVNECWKRGVILREPGWFFAREGALAVGTPWDDPLLTNMAAKDVNSKQALLVLREVPNGSH